MTTKAIPQTVSFVRTFYCQKIMEYGKGKKPQEDLGILPQEVCAG